MKIDIHSIELGLKTFYRIKHGEEVEYTDIPDVTENIMRLKLWVAELDKHDQVQIVVEDSVKLSHLLDKYFRDEFIEFCDTKSIKEYLRTKRGKGLDGHIMLGLMKVKKTGTEFHTWLSEEHKYIEWLKEHKNYNEYSIAENIKHVSYAMYKKKKVRALLTNYFLGELRGVFAKIHLNMALGFFNTRINNKQKSKLTINQIALKYVYECQQITRKNGNDIAKQYGHNSGEKLFQKFTYFSSAANRKGKPTPCTLQKLNNKVKLIESVIALLPDDKKQRAKDEVLILKRIQEAEYQ